ncbi:MAG TPA: hypothetical protein VMB73_25545 [Acetobacteraceae bacterium]|nr:hypothetical protein [Acetobacteraceae bacterium]
MSETTTRDPRTEPIHPNPHVRANNPYLAAKALREKHAVGVALAQRAVTGGKLSPDEKQAAADELDAVLTVLAADGPAHQAFAYLLESATAGTRLHRQQAEVA